MMLLTRLMVTMVMITCKEEKKEKDEAGGDDEMEERSGGLGCHPSTGLHLLQALGDNWINLLEAEAFIFRSKPPLFDPASLPTHDKTDIATIFKFFMLFLGI